MVRRATNGRIVRSVGGRIPLIGKAQAASTGSGGRSNLAWSCIVVDRLRRVADRPAGECRRLIHRNTLGSEHGAGAVGTAPSLNGGCSAAQVVEINVTGCTGGALDQSAASSPTASRTAPVQGIRIGAATCRRICTGNVTGDQRAHVLCRR